MRSTFKKATYKVTIDPWGSQKELTLYCHCNNTVGIDSIYDEKGNLLFHDEPGGIGQAIQTLLSGKGEPMTPEEILKIT